MPTNTIPTADGGERRALLIELRYLAAWMETEAASLRVKIATLEAKDEPTPSAFERELVRRVAAGEVVLPKKGSHLDYKGKLDGRWTWHCEDCDFVWIGANNGRLPEWTEGDPTTIDLTPIHEQAKRLAQESTL